MKKKIVIGMDLSSEKRKRKAIKTLIANTPGALDTVEGSKYNELVVVGEGLDPVCLVSALRKKVGPASVVSVADVDAKKKKKDDVDAKKKKKKDDVDRGGYVRWCPYYSYPQPPPHVVVCNAPDETPSCVVM